MKINKLLIIALTLVMCALIVVQYFIFYTLSYTFTIIMLYIVGIIITGIYYNRKNMPHNKFLIYATVLGICLALLLSSGLIPLAVYKSEYLEIKDIRAEKYGDRSVKIYTEVWAKEGIQDEFMLISGHAIVSAQIQVSISDTSGMSPISVDSTTITQAASWTEGETTSYYFGIWEIDEAGGSFNIYVRILAGDTARQGEADNYSVQRGYTFESYQGSIDDSDDNGDDNDDDSEPSWSVQQDRYTEVFAEMFQQVVNDSLTATTIACIFLGSIAIIMGKSGGDKRAYYFGSLVAVLPVIFTVLSLYFGWVSPSPYFIELAGPNLASFTQAIITLIVLAMFVFVPYVFADLIGSPYE